MAVRETEVLITGGAGFIGSSIARALSLDNHVRILTTSLQVKRKTFRESGTLPSSRAT
ncbi:MAG: NAD-dependent epimerase/dehydratase family protein [Candidatus Aenigmatarchaeota archaeon]